MVVVGEAVEEKGFDREVRVPLLRSSYVFFMPAERNKLGCN